MPERQPNSDTTSHKKNGLLILLNRLESGYESALQSVRHAYSAANQCLNSLEPGTRDAIWAAIAGTAVIIGMQLADEELSLTPRSENVVDYRNSSSLQQYTGEVLLASLSDSGMSEAEQRKTD